MDEHIHPGITKPLRTRGIDVLTVLEDGRGHFPDVELLNRALVLTPDEHRNRVTFIPLR